MYYTKVLRDTNIITEYVINENVNLGEVNQSKLFSKEGYIDIEDYFNLSYKEQEIIDRILSSGKYGLIYDLRQKSCFRLIRVS